MDLTADLIDIRDVIEAIEAYEDEESPGMDDEEQAARLALMAELAGYGGDEEWRGDWYPCLLIRDDHFEDYARQLVEDIGDLPNGMPAYIVVDWQETAENIRQDYSCVEIAGVTYWYR